MRVLAVVLAACAVLVLAPGSASATVADQWALQYLKARQCWSVSKGGGVTVAVVDTGVRPVGDVAGQVLAGADFAFSTTRSTDTGQNDMFGHGTAVAVDIAGTGAHAGVNGLAPAAKILPIAVDTGSAQDTPALGTAIRWAVDHGAGVVDIDLVNTGTSQGEAAAIRYAVAHDVVVVAPAGNLAADENEHPAVDPGVIGVSSIQQDGTFWPGSNSGSDVVLAAPGAHILVQDLFGGTGYDEGSSHASAYVSAAAALVRSAHPSWTAGQVIRDLIDTADQPAGQTGRTHRYGYGIVNPLKALRAAAPARTGNPLAPAARATPTVRAAASSSSSTGLIIGIAAAVVVVAGGAAALLTRRRRRP